MTELETRRMTGKFAKKIGALLLSLAFLATAPQAGAEERVQPGESAGILDEAALTALVEGYIEEKGLKSENIGVGSAPPHILFRPAASSAAPCTCWRCKTSARRCNTSCPKKNMRGS